MPVLPDTPTSGVPDGWVPNIQCCTNWASYDPGVQAYALDIASFGVWSLTGRRYGTSIRTVRPCNAPNLPPLYQTFPVNWLNPWGVDEDNTYWGLFIFNGVWHNIGCGGFNCCGAACEVLLDGPVVSIESVIIDGAPLDSSAYRVDDGHILVRQDAGCWPRCQDLNKAAGQTDTWTVSYAVGEPVPSTILSAAGVLACEVAKSCSGSTCRLPQRMQSLTRQGVSVQFIQPADYLDRGLTGIPEVDMAVAWANPGRLTQRPRVASLDISPNRQTTWP